MQSKIVIYKYGHFYNKTTGERIELRENKEYILGGNDKDFIKKKFVGERIKSRSSEEVLEAVKKKSKKYVLLLESDKELFFKINIKKEEVIFKAIIKEDLYAYKTKSSVALSRTPCVVKEYISKREMPFFEEIHGKSLSDIYSCTHRHYIGNMKSDVRQVKNHFFTDVSLKDSTKLSNFITL